MKQTTTPARFLAFILLVLCFSPFYSTAQIALEATYPTTDLRRLNLPSGEIWYYANDSTRQIRVFDAVHRLKKIVPYPSEANKKVALDVMNMPVSETTFNRDNLLEFVWRFTDSTTSRERVKILNELNDSVYFFSEGYNYLTVNELAGSPTKLFVESTESYNYKTTVFGLPNMVFENAYVNASNMHRQKFGYAGEKYYFKNVPQKLLLIYNSNHTLYKTISIPVPTNGASTSNYDPVFFADDKIFNADSLVEFAFSYDNSNGYSLAQIVNENGTPILKINSNSSFILDQQIGQPNKIFFTYNASINTVNTSYQVMSLPGATLENTYPLPVQRILLKQYGAKYINLEYYGTLKIFNTTHSLWKTINMPPTSGYHFTYNYNAMPIICDSIVHPDSLLEVIWTQASDTSPVYQVRITNENGSNIATIPNARAFQLSQVNGLPTKLITKTWDSTRYTETKVWRFTARTPVSDPSVSTGLNVQISPNPFTTAFSINNLEIDRPLSIRLFNTVGKLVFSEKINTPQTTLTPPNGLPAGLYLLHITDGEKKIVKRLIKI